MPSGRSNSQVRSATATPHRRASDTALSVKKPLYLNAASRPRFDTTLSTSHRLRVPGRSLAAIRRPAHQSMPVSARMTHR